MKRILRFKKRTFVLFGVAAVAAVTAVGGYAYWTTSGTGDGSATTGTSQAVTVTQLGSVTNLVPGGPAQDIGYRITNPASFNQYVASVTVSVLNADLTVWSSQTDPLKPACSAADFSITGSPDPVGADLPTGDNDYSPSGVTIQLLDSATNQDNCKSVTVPLHFEANAS